MLHCCEYLSSNIHIIVEKVADNTINWLDIINCIISVCTLFTGAWCFVRIKKLKEKRLDAMFSFLTRLSIRLKLLISSLEKYSTDIQNALCYESTQSGEEEDDNSYSSNIVLSFLATCQETLTFLMNSDNQVPIQIGWIKKYKKLIEFLDVYVKTEDENFFMWLTDESSKKEKFFDEHLKNMKSMLKEIEAQQTKLEEEICKEHFWNKKQQKAKSSNEETNNTNEETQ